MPTVSEGTVRTATVIIAAVAAHIVDLAPITTPSRRTRDSSAASSGALVTGTGATYRSVHVAAGLRRRSSRGHLATGASLDAFSWPGSSGVGDAPRAKGSWNSLNSPRPAFHIGDRTAVGKNVHGKLLVAGRQELFFLCRWQGLFGTSAAANQGCRRQRRWHAHRRSRQGVISLPRFEVSCCSVPTDPDSCRQIS